MVDVATALSELANATTLQEIQAIAESLSAQATGSGGVLYTGYVGGAPARQVALQIASSTGQSIIDNTDRGIFLSNSAVETKIIQILEATNLGDTAGEIMNLAIVADCVKTLASVAGMRSARELGLNPLSVRHRHPVFHP